MKRSEMLWAIDDVLRKHFGFGHEEAAQKILNKVEEAGMLPPVDPRDEALCYDGLHEEKVASTSMGARR